MFKKVKHLKNEKGLTLIELLAVIVILAIIAAIAIPAIGNIIDNQRIKAVKADAANIISAANIYYADNGSSTPFEIKSDGTGVGYSYVDIDESQVAEDVTVSSNGLITGEITKNGKTLIMRAASLSALEIDSKNTGTATGPYEIE